MSGRYGAIGLSRREDLMYKPLKFTVSGNMCLFYSVNLTKTGLCKIADSRAFFELMKCNILI